MEMSNTNNEVQTKKKKQIKQSKNRKKYWKKCDINDVEEYLEDNRFDERIGGSLSNKTDESLFIIEKTGNVDAIDDNLVEKTECVANRSNKLAHIKSNLKFLRSLEPQSMVTPMRAQSAPKKRLKKTILSKDSKFLKHWPQNVINHKKAKQQSIERQSINLDPKLRFQVYDLWQTNDEKINDKLDDNRNDEMRELSDIQLVLRGLKPPKVSRYRYQKPSLLRAIEVPDSGASYNPCPNEHQKLIQKACNVEIEKINEELKLKRKVDDYYVTKSDAPNDRTWVNEMSHGLGLSDDENDLDEQLSDNIDEILPSIKAVNRENKKSKSMRRKELMKKQEMADKTKQKQMKAKENHVFKLKHIKKEIADNEKKSIEKQKRKSQRLIARMYKSHKLSRFQYQDLDIEVNLTEELTGSLRAVKTDGNLLEDRFKSLQRRNVIETRAKHLFKRKYKLKKINKK